MLLLIVFFLGMYSYHNETIRDFIFSVKNVKNLSYSNYQDGKNASPNEINLLIPDSSQQVLNDCQSRAMDAGILRDENKIEVPAQLVFSKDTFNIKMRLKGDYSDHWSTEKWSYRIKMSGDDRLMGMKSFAIQSPETRGFLNEWYFHKLMKKEGLIALRYSFATLKENGKDKGVYAIEESFDKQLIELNNRREAPILKLDESILIDKSILNKNDTYSQENLFLMAKVDVFKSKRTLKNPILFDQYKKGKYLINGLRTKTVSLENAVDIDKAAKLFAIADLTGGHHCLRWKNVRFYFNPVIGKLELIGFDSNSGHMISDIYYNRWYNDHIGEFEVKVWKDIFFENEHFVNTYFKYLRKYSQEEFLQNFHEETSGERELYLTYMYKENSSYKFFIDHYTSNASVIRNKLKEFESTEEPEFHKYFVNVTSNRTITQGLTKLELNLNNNSYEELIVFGAFDTSETKISSDQNITIDGRGLNQRVNENKFELNLINAIDSNQIKLKRNDNRWVHRKIKVGYSFVGQTDTFYTKIESYYDCHLNLNHKTDFEDIIAYNDEDKTARISKGNYQIANDIEIKPNYSLHIEAGTQMDLINNSVLAVNAHCEMMGTEAEPIIISSSDSSGSFLVYQSSNRSKVNYTIFNALSECHSGKWHHSGSVNFYEADVDLDNVTFSNNSSEDALNVIRSKFTLSNSNFEHIYSDAFDGDFCQGKLTNLTFNDIGNDGIDFSGSIIEVENLVISNVGDKGVSAGEMSSIRGEKISVLNAELGLVSKDLSSVILDDVKLDNVRVGYTAFKKKEMFGPAKIELNNYKTTNIEEDFFLENQSRAEIDGITIEPNHADVTSLLYGNQFGKSSK